MCTRKLKRLQRKTIDVIFLFSLSATRRGRTGGRRVERLRRRLRRGGRRRLRRRVLRRRRRFVVAVAVCPVAGVCGREARRSAPRRENTRQGGRSEREKLALRGRGRVVGLRLGLLAVSVSALAVAVPRSRRVGLLSVREALAVPLRVALERVRSLERPRPPATHREPDEEDDDCYGDGDWTSTNAGTRCVW